MARFSINISSLYSKTLIQKKNPIFLSVFLSTCFFALLFFVFLFFSLLHLIICLGKERERERERKSSKRKHFSFLFFLSLAIASLLWLNISLMLRWFSFYNFPNGGGLVLINYTLIGNCWLVTMMLHTSFFLFFSLYFPCLLLYLPAFLFFSLSLSLSLSRILLQRVITIFLEFFCSVLLQFYPFILEWMDWILQPTKTY